ncbi:bacteriophage holin [Lactococcus lactis]|uniref:bacteriophage holin n=1 Tax=Lactococcus lactis TaxID=1358 RepID=UPI0018D9842B|nr:bacteriophage holin [Lactococcus lactis]MBU6000514.1 bacteriophage holin [Lactococcus lactis]QPS96378.1 bacteriophage holin [Lactococcus lactis]QPT50336.1 bacteriophage holin [Lactococcus lactis]QTP71136.1 bacteriophage holin [Lactococcus lactis subsp. lactis bv. diacetylactis]
MSGEIKRSFPKRGRFFLDNGNRKLYNFYIPKNTFLINSFLSVPLVTGALFLCYNIVGMFVRFHPIPRVKPFFGVAFFK